MDNKEKLRKIYKDNGLTKDDVFVLSLKDKRTGEVSTIPIIKRSGIEKIANKRGIELEFSAELLTLELCVVKCMATMHERYVETFGESSKANCTNAYPVAMAEKRAMSRAVLKLVGMYEEGYLGEDELPEQFEYDPEHLHELINTSTFDDEQRKHLVLKANTLRNQDEYMRLYFNLTDNQLQHMDIPGARPSQTDIKKQLKEQGL